MNKFIEGIWVGKKRFFCRKRFNRRKKLQYQYIGVKEDNKFHTVLQNSITIQNLSLRVKEPISEKGTKRLSLPLLWHDSPVHTT